MIPFAAAAAIQALPALTNIGVGLFQQSKANKMSDGSNKLPQGYDPMTLNYLSNIRKRQYQLRSGTDPSSTVLMNDLNKQNATAMSQVFKTGNPGLIQNTLQTLTDAKGDVMAKVNASSNAAADNLEGAALQATTSLAESNKQLKFWKALQDLRAKTELQQTAQTNIAGGMGNLISDLSTSFLAKYGPNEFKTGNK